ncbi:amidohydrolase family protein [Leekyejoonella antrihumi]|uniref:Amidohydrolase family protein n=2 Tax=Leekyejoonella antrihumi TaxID=1660198 RepID=A0A563DSW7_9MICO|nr:amidohydrolase family protein [Leekyejoonella antrihumi]
MAHVVIEGGMIRAMVDAGSPIPAARQVVHAGGRLVIPGGVDGHCHVAQVTGRYRTLDDYAVSSMAALWGGTTTIIDFGIPRDDSESPLQAAHNKRELARVARCDVALHGSVITWDDTVPKQLDELVAMGICSVKVYTTNRATTMADDDTILQVMHAMARIGGLVYIHAEHDPIIIDCARLHAQAGHTSIHDLHRTRPPVSEETSVREMLGMAEYTGAAVYFVHQTTPGAVDLVQRARDRGIQAYSETCPHYLAVDDSVYATADAALYACCPPLRDATMVTQLRDRLISGRVHTISSDHSCYDTAQKRERMDKIQRMPHGLPGVETRMPVTYTVMVRELGLPVERFVDVFATTPARINHLPRKGVIATGYDADLVIVDPDATRRVDGGALHMGTNYSPFEGRELAGWPETVVSGGRVVLSEGTFDDPGPIGRFLHRTPTGDQTPSTRQATARV